MRSTEFQNLYVMPRSLTESCPDRYWGASLSMLGLMGDVTEMDGRSIFWDSKELEPDGTQSGYLVGDVGLSAAEGWNERGGKVGGRKEERKVERGGGARR